MTTLAFDGTTLAADRAAFQNNTVIADVCKLACRSDGAIAGIAGSGSLGAAFLRWFLAGCTTERPSLGTSEADATEAIIIHPSGIIELHDLHGYSEPSQPPLALGAGAELALGAMDAGADAEQAVKIATRRIGGNPELVDSVPAYQLLRGVA